jgi:hypothetical protein
MIFTFKQRSEESFKEAWSRISDSYGKTEPKMTLGLLLSSFYFGLVLCYRYALDVVAGGDFLYCDGDQAFNVIKKLIAIYSSPSKFDSSLVSIHARLDTIETNTTCLKECYNMLREHHDYVPINSEPSRWLAAWLTTSWEPQEEGVMSTAVSFPSVMKPKFNRLVGERNHF